MRNEPLDCTGLQAPTHAKLRPYLRFNFAFMCATDINRVGCTKRTLPEIKYQSKDNLEDFTHLRLIQITSRIKIRILFFLK